VNTDSLAVSYEQSAPDSGLPIVLLHGCPGVLRPGLREEANMVHFNTILRLGIGSNVVVFLSAVR